MGAWEAGETVAHPSYLADRCIDLELACIDLKKLLKWVLGHKNHMNQEKDLIPIGEATQLLGISIMTLRRWDESGRFPAIRKQEGGDRYYKRKDIEIFMNDLFRLAREWVAVSIEFPQGFYCQTSAVFQTRLVRMQDDMIRSGTVPELFSLLVSVAGEIGNNSFDHNLGLWPDTPGVFFGYDLNKKQIVLADRGVGILETLRRVRPGLMRDADALEVAFTEVVSGRAPEGRGNGLKYVKEVVSENKLKLFFQSGDAQLTMPNKTNELEYIIVQSGESLRGCLALISY